MAHGGCRYFLHRDSESEQSDDLRLLVGVKVATEDSIEYIEACTPKAEENPVISALRTRGLYSKSLGNGKHDIVCPFSQNPEVKAKYYEPTPPQRPRGGYHCTCALCNRKHRISDLLKLLEVSKAESLHKPTFKVIGGELATIVDATECELSKTITFFQQGGVIVKVVTDDQGQTKLAAMNKTSLNLEFNRLFTWEKYDKRSKQWFVVDAPLQYSYTLFDAMSYEHLPSILSVAKQPFIRADSTLCRLSGYDAASKIYGFFDEQKYPIPEMPTPEQLKTAQQELCDLLEGFEFKADSDYAAALCAMLTAVVRPVLPTAPGILATAHCAGSGKSYLLDIIGQFASGAPAAAASFLADDDEMRKQLIAALVDSPQVIKFDEMKSDLLPIKTLLSCLSAEQVEGRILGASKIVRPSTRTLMLFAGNNVQAVNDMCRRIMTIHLDVKSESPATRSFANSPLEKLEANREHYVSQALMLITWALKQNVKNIKILSGFSRWEKLCRNTVIALGFTDPCTNIFNQLDHDPDRDQLGAVLEAWHKLHGVTSFKVRDVIAQTTKNSELYEVMHEVAYAKDDGIDPRNFSRWIKRNIGKIVNGKRFEQDTTYKTNVAKFFVALTLCPDRGDSSDYSDLSDSLDKLDSDTNNLQSRINRNNRMNPPALPKMAEPKKNNEAILI